MWAFLFCFVVQEWFDVSAMMLHWDLIAAGVDAGIFLLFYKLYKHASREADLIKVRSPVSLVLILNPRLLV
jgi:hypothetical protein